MKQNWWNDLLYRKIRFMVLSNFFENSKWLPAAILKMTSNLKSDSRNGLSRSKSFQKYMLFQFLLPKIAYSDIMLLFQNGGWQPSWNSKINLFGAGNLVFVLVNILGNLLGKLLLLFFKLSAMAAILDFYFKANLL